MADYWAVRMAGKWVDQMGGSSVDELVARSVALRVDSWDVQKAAYLVGTKGGWMASKLVE